MAAPGIANFICGKCLVPLTTETGFLVPKAIQRIVVDKTGTYFQDAVGYWSFPEMFCKYCIMKAVGASPNDFPLPSEE